MWSRDFFFRVKNPTPLQVKVRRKIIQASITAEDQAQGARKPCKTSQKSCFTGFVYQWMRSMMLRAPVCVCLGQLKLIWETEACPVSLYKLVLPVVTCFGLCEQGYTWRPNTLCVNTTEEFPPTSLLSRLESFVEGDAYVLRGIVKE